jgi:hypothetical protein
MNQFWANPAPYVKFDLSIARPGVASALAPQELAARKGAMSYLELFRESAKRHPGRGATSRCGRVGAREPVSEDRKSSRHRATGVGSIHFPGEPKPRFEGFTTRQA